jgi:hypothetical protein
MRAKLPFRAAAAGIFVCAAEVSLGNPLPRGGCVMIAAAGSNNDRLALGGEDRWR